MSLFRSETLCATAMVMRMRLPARNPFFVLSHPLQEALELSAIRR